MIFNCKPAHADENYYFARITCVPELRLFQVDLIHTTNLPWNGQLLEKNGAWKEKSSDQLARQYGIYDTVALKKNPVHCIVPGHVRSDRSTSVWPSFEVVVGTSPINGAETVKVNGVYVEELFLDQISGAESISSIKVLDDGVGISIKICRPDLGVPWAQKCKQHYLDVR